MSVNRRHFLFGIGGVVGGAAITALSTSTASAHPTSAGAGLSTPTTGPVDLQALAGMTAEYFTDRARRASLNPPDIRETRKLALSPQLRAVYESEMPLLGQQSKRSRMFHGGYRSAQSDVALSSVEVSGAYATAVVTEFTRLDFERASSSTSPNSRYIATHSASYVRSPGGWKLQSIQYTDAAPLAAPITQFHETVSDAVKPYIDPDREVLANRHYEDTRSARFSAGAPRYNTREMVAYAHRWWNGQNPAYPRFGGGEQDCTNFVSQCMHAGGWPIRVSLSANPRADAESWYFGPRLELCSYSWTAAHNLYLHDWHSNMAQWCGPMGAPAGSQMLWRPSVDHNFEHAQIVTGQINNGVPLLTQHSQPYVDRPLYDIAATKTDDFWALIDPGFGWGLDCPIVVEGR